MTDASRNFVNTVSSISEVTTSDVTENRAHDAMVEVVESLGEGVALYDSDLLLRLSNESLHRLAHEGRPRMPHGTHMAEHCAYVFNFGSLAIPEGSTAEEFADIMINAARSYAKNLPFQSKDGRHLEFSSYPTSMGGYLIRFVDVTEKVRAASAEREADIRVRTIVESLGEGVALYDADQRMLMNNPAFRRLVMNDLPLSKPGTTLRDEIRASIDAKLIDVPEGSSAEDVLDWINQCVIEARQNVELPMADGRVLEASNFHTQDGGVLIAMRDITSRKQAENATREADALIRTIVEASPTSFMVSRVKDGRVLYAAPQTRAQLGASNLSHDFYTDPADRARYLEALLPTGRLDDWPVKMRRLDGEPMDVLVSARIVWFRGEEIAISSYRDVTDELAMRAKIEAQKEIAYQAEKLSALGELLAGVAHELNNPLSLVVGHAQMLHDTVEDPAMARRVEKISAAAQRSARIVKMFLAMARQRPTRIEPCDINEIVRAALDFSAYGLRAVGVEVVTSLDETLQEFGADPDQIAQVISNLIVNAEQALQGQSKPRLKITTKSLAGAVEVVIADNGPGVPPALRPRIFEPFFTTKDVGVGTGFGLAFCHRTVTTHGGELKLSSPAEGGATFTLRLPNNEIGNEFGQESDSATMPQSARVLILDDEKDMVDLLDDILTRDGYDVTACTEASRALEICKTTSFDVILSDIRMPGMDGPAFLRALRLAAPGQAERLVFLTGDAMGRGIEAFLTECGRPFAEKPLSPSEILALVRNVIEEDKG